MKEFMFRCWKRAWLIDRRGEKLFPTAARLFAWLPRFLRRHRLMLGWIRLTGEDPVQLVEVLPGVHGYADLREGMLRLIVIDGEFERDFFRLAEVLLPRGGTFFDVGANFGLISVGLAGAVAPRAALHVFEPNPFLLPWLERSFLQFGQSAISLNSCAVGDAEGTVRIQFNPLHTGASFVSSQGTGDQVRCIRLDDYIRQRQIRQIDLMKLDVEGYELAVLRGMQQSLQSGVVRCLYFEFAQQWLARHCQPLQVLQLLQECGFRLFYCRQHDRSRAGIGFQSVRLTGMQQSLELGAVDLRELPEETDLLAIHSTALDAGNGSG